MARYIDADKLICSLDGSECLDTERDYEEIERRIEECETADVQEVKHGKWGKQVLVTDEYGDKHIGYICPVCKKFVPNKGNYCLECGAKMDGKDDD